MSKKTVKRAFCTTREAAELLGISLRTAQLWTESGLLEAWKTDGGHRRITRASIERLLVDSAGVRANESLARMAKSTGSTVTSERRPFCVVVAEEDLSLRRLYEFNLMSWPMQPAISTPADGYEALIRIGQYRPHMLITELQLSGLDGFKLLHTLRQDPTLADMLIAVVTAISPAEIAARGGVPEGVVVFSKPVPFDKLMALAHAHKEINASVS